MTENAPLYRDAGVDIDAGRSAGRSDQATGRGNQARRCGRRLGGFGALFDLKAAGFKDPILVAGPMGSAPNSKSPLPWNGTIRSASISSPCASTILVQGAEPLFFLDYFACGKLELEAAREVMRGIAAACAEFRLRPGRR